jgi:hypothetical protein
MDRLCEKGYISDPKSKAMPVALSDEGVKQAKELFERFFVNDEGIEEQSPAQSR